MAESFPRKEVDEIKDEFRRYMGILKEDFQKSIGFVIDGQKDLERRLTGKIESTAKDLRKELTGKIESTEERLSRKIESEIVGLRKDIKQEIIEVRQELIAHRDNTEVHTQKAKRKSKAS